MRAFSIPAVAAVLAAAGWAAPAHAQFVYYTTPGAYVYNPYVYAPVATRAVAPIGTRAVVVEPTYTTRSLYVEPQTVVTRDVVTEPRYITREIVTEPTVVTRTVAVDPVVPVATRAVVVEPVVVAPRGVIRGRRPW